MLINNRIAVNITPMRLFVLWYLGAFCFCAARARSSCCGRRPFFLVVVVCCRYVRWDLGVISWAEVAATAGIFTAGVLAGLAALSGSFLTSSKPRWARVALGVMIAAGLVTVSGPWGQEVCRLGTVVPRQPRVNME